jgi:hypothetical protein
VAATVLTLVTLGGLFAVRTLAQPAPEVPAPKRVVKVNVQPSP